MASRPDISVVIPAYNQERFIRQCLDKVLAVENLNVEVVVVNDGSTDSTSEILATYDNQIVVVNQENKGLPAARNTGLRHASGKYVLPLDSDDIPEPDQWLSMHHALETSPQFVAAYGDRMWFVEGDDGVVSSPLNIVAQPAPDELRLNTLERNTYFSSGSVLVRKDALDSVGEWNEQLTYGEDWEMWCKLISLGDFLYTPGVALNYRRYPTQMTQVLDASKTLESGQMAIDSIYSSSLVRESLGTKWPAHKRRATAWNHLVVGKNTLDQKQWTQGARIVCKGLLIKPSLALGAIFNRMANGSQTKGWT